MQLTLVSFLCDTWTPIKTAQGAGHGPLFVLPHGRLLPGLPLVPCNISMCSQLLGKEVKREGREAEEERGKEVREQSGRDELGRRCFSNVWH